MSVTSTPVIPTVTVPADCAVNETVATVVPPLMLSPNAEKEFPELSHVQLLPLESLGAEMIPVLEKVKVPCAPPNWEPLMEKLMVTVSPTVTEVELAERLALVAYAGVNTKQADTSRAASVMERIFLNFMQVSVLTFQISGVVLCGRNFVFSNDGCVQPDDVGYGNFSVPADVGSLLFRFGKGELI